MRILMLRQFYPPERGPVRYFYDLSVFLAMRGHKVTVITGLPNYPQGSPYEGFGRFLPDIREEEGIRVIRVPLLMASNRAPIRRIFGFITFALSALPWLLFVSRPDLFIASVPPVTVGPLAVLIARIRKIPLVMMLNDYEPLRSFELRGIVDRPLSRKLIWLFTRLYERAEKIVVTIETEFEALLANGMPKEKIEVITHGIDLERFIRDSQKQIPFVLPRRARRQVALYVGTIGIAHAVEMVVAAFSDPRIRGLPVDLVILGDGEFAPICLETINRLGLDNVTIIPPVPLDWIPSILTQADLLVCSQKPDLFSFGSKFYEYLAAGKPLLVNSTGILAKTVKNIGNGWVCDARKPENVLSALEKFINSPEESKRLMGIKSRRVARELFNLSDRHDMWEKLLVNLARK